MIGILQILYKSSKFNISETFICGFCSSKSKVFKCRRTFKSQVLLIIHKYFNSKNFLNNQINKLIFFMSLCHLCENLCRCCVTVCVYANRQIPIQTYIIITLLRSTPDKKRIISSTIHITKSIVEIHVTENLLMIEADYSIYHPSTNTHTNTLFYS